MPPTPLLPQKQHTTNHDRGHVKECSGTGPGDQLNHIESLEKQRGGNDQKQNTTLLYRAKCRKLEAHKNALDANPKTRNTKFEIILTKTTKRQFNNHVTSRIGCHDYTTVKGGVAVASATEGP